jgi:hypothetical protein
VVVVGGAAWWVSAPYYTGETRAAESEVFLAAVRQAEGGLMPNDTLVIVVPAGSECGSRGVGEVQRARVLLRGLAYEVQAVLGCANLRPLTPSELRARLGSTGYRRTAGVLGRPWRPVRYRRGYLRFWSRFEDAGYLAYNSESVQIIFFSHGNRFGSETECTYRLDPPAGGVKTERLETREVALERMPNL